MSSYGRPRSHSGRGSRARREYDSDSECSVSSSASESHPPHNEGSHHSRQNRHRQGSDTRRSSRNTCQAVVPHRSGGGTNTEIIPRSHGIETPPPAYTPSDPYRKTWHDEHPRDFDWDAERARSEGRRKQRRRNLGIFAGVMCFVASLFLCFDNID
jgi:hypothetical protein